MDVSEKYLRRVPIIREVAKRHGYAIGEHGSKSRDYDLIAVPWVESASHCDVLIEEIRIAIDGVIVQEPEDKPHGRIGWNIVIGKDLYFDISVMPLLPSRCPYCGTPSDECGGCPSCECKADDPGDWFTFDR